VKLLSPELQRKAQLVAEKMKHENGVREAAASFKKHLPLRDMICDVSVFLEEPLVAR